MTRSSATTPSWFSDDDHCSMRRVEYEFATLAAIVDPDDPWSHPHAVALDNTAVTSWLGSIGATPNVRRALEAGQLGLSSGSFERTSLLGAAAQVRQHAEQGSLLLRRMGEPACRRGICNGRAADGRRARRPHPIELCWYGRSSSRPASCSVQLQSGEIVHAGAVVSALPAGPFRDITVEGVSDARLESLHRQRHALAAKFVAAYDRPFWRDRGQNGLTESEDILGSSWPQTEGVLSCLVPPERIRGLPVHRGTAPARGGARRARRPVGTEATHPDRELRAAVGDGSLDTGIRDAVAAGRRAPGGAAARYPRATVLCMRLRSMGGRLHGGCGAHRTRGGLRSAGARMTEIRSASHARGSACDQGPEWVGERNHSSLPFSALGRIQTVGNRPRARGATTRSKTAVACRLWRCVRRVGVVFGRCGPRGVVARGRCGRRGLGCGCVAGSASSRHDHCRRVGQWFRGARARR